MQSVYLDNNATTQPDPQVLAAMMPFFTQQFGNASSKHAFGADAAAAMKNARRQVQRLIGAESENEIVFTSGGTESDCAAILSALDSQQGRDEIVTSAVEHPAVLALCDHLQRTRGVKVHTIGVDGKGRLDIEAFVSAVNSRTAIASIMWANNETGTLFPVRQLAAHARSAGALFHTDAVQAVGRVPVNVSTMAIDMLSLSAHKFHGPKGCGALYVRQGVKFQPLLRGGRQERGRRPGTENTPGIVGCGQAAELCRKGMVEAGERVAQLRDELEAGLLERVSGAVVLGDVENRLSNTLNIAFEDVESDALVTLLDHARIAVSSGAACASGSMEPSHVLRAMRVPFMLAHGALRFSLSRMNTREDISRVLETLPTIVARLRDRVRPPAIEVPPVTTPVYGDRP